MYTSVVRKRFSWLMLFRPQQQVLLLMLLLLLLIILLPLSNHSPPLPVSLGVTYAYAQPSWPMVSAVSGSTLFWQTFLMIASVHPEVKSAVLLGLELDLQNTVGADMEVTINDLTVNASAMFIWYEYKPLLGTSITPVQLRNRLRGTHLVATEFAISILIEGRFLSEVEELLPTAVTLIDPLFYDPNAPDLTKVPLTDNVTYAVRLLFSGEPAMWSMVLHRSSLELVAAVEQAIAVMTTSRRLVCTTMFHDAVVIPEDPAWKSIGDGSGGLLVSTVSNCAGTIAMTGRFLDTDEYASWLLSINMKNISAVYSNSSDSAYTVHVATTAVGGPVKIFECKATCRGIIALGVFLLGLIFICVIITVVFYFMRRLPLGPIKMEIRRKVPRIGVPNLQRR